MKPRQVKGKLDNPQRQRINDKTRTYEQVTSEKRAILRANYERLNITQWKQ